MQYDAFGRSQAGTVGRKEGNGLYLVEASYSTTVKEGAFANASD